MKQAGKLLGHEPSFKGRGMQDIFVFAYTILYSTLYHYIVLVNKFSK